MIELLCLITNVNDDKKFKNIQKDFNLPFNLATFGNGTASSSMLEYFGLEEIKKYIYFSLVDKDRRKDIFDNINNILHLEKHGNGILFSIPLSSSTKYIIDKINKSKSMEVNMDDTNKKNSNKNYELIVTIVNEGYSETVMNTAKKEGAGGGTLIRGRSLLKNDPKRQFLGFSIEPEKDIVLIVANSKIKKNIMESITNVVGLKTKGSGIVFALPISDVIGLVQD